MWYFDSELDSENSILHCHVWSSSTGQHINESLPRVKFLLVIFWAHNEYKVGVVFSIQLMLFWLWTHSLVSGCLPHLKFVQVFTEKHIVGCTMRDTVRELLLLCVIWNWRWLKLKGGGVSNSKVVLVPNRKVMWFNSLTLSFYIFCVWLWLGFHIGLGYSAVLFKVRVCLGSKWV